MVADRSSLGMVGHRVFPGLLELYLLSSAIAGLFKTGVLEGDPRELDAEAVFNGLGKAAQKLESRRRQHWVLDARPEMDLSEAHPGRGIRAFAVQSKGKTEQALLRAVHKQLRRRSGEAAAAETMRRLGERAAD